MKCKTAADLGMEDTTGDWIFMPEDCPEPEDACSKLMKCGECMDNMDCTYEKTKHMCATAADLGSEDLTGDWAWMKEDCPAPEDACAKLMKCGDCMDNMDCAYEKTKKMCKTAADMGDD